MISSTCPFCDLSVPSSELEWHANSHFQDDDDRRHQQQLATDYELAQQIALSPNSSPQSVPPLPFGEQAASGFQEESTSADHNSRCGGGSGTRDNEKLKLEEKISSLIDLQTRSTFYKVEGGLMALLRSCVESEPGNSKSILSGYVDHFQSLESEDAGWGCGWRNIQMLSSHLMVQRSEAREVLFGGSGFVPDIPSLQRWLEIAWERGFDEAGSEQFDHVVYGSKKWVGTTECAALLRSFGLPARIVDFGPKESESLYLSVPGSSPGTQQMKINNGSKRKALCTYGPMDRYLSPDVCQANSGQDEKLSDTMDKPSTDDIANKNKGHQLLIDYVWNYFSNSSSIQFGHRRVLVTEKTPLYFQHDGHSRTIVGIQVKHQQTGSLQYNLLVFDPAHKTAALERSLREKVGWQKLIKRGIHTLKKPQYQLCYVDPGIVTEEEIENLKTVDSVFLEF
ncbi:zinc finger with UFM1-specific peptidase domain protein isoform X1 [Senna tora]|uniref:Zinc finger with UFM1-specific peptidase domain protein isoform X1 n=1 Tax=Senna tora TaxID=362788 RepID=A0A834T9D3_9FABA|nr:zinc finger with UFM1-specific peptidase domain protein isoform X1 [Senna tora]